MKNFTIVSQIIVILFCTLFINKIASKANTTDYQYLLSQDTRIIRPDVFVRPEVPPPKSTQQFEGLVPVPTPIRTRPGPSTDVGDLLSCKSNSDCPDDNYSCVKGICIIK